MTDLEQFCERIQAAATSLVEGFAALGRALRPAIQAMQRMIEGTSNRKSRRALRSGKFAQWQWYLKEHIRRCQSKKVEDETQS